MTKVYNRFQVAALASQLGIDSHAAWMGNEISDKLVSSLVESREKLAKVEMERSKTAVLVIDARKVFVWRVTLCGDTYERSIGAHNVRGSLALLREIYGAASVTVTNEAGAAKMLTTKKADVGTLAFYGLSHLVKSGDKDKEAKDKLSTKRKDKAKK